MQKLIYAIGAIVLAAAAAFVWSRTALAPLNASTASSINLTRTAVASSDATASISPTNMMMNHKGQLSAEQWEPF